MLRGILFKFIAGIALICGGGPAIAGSNRLALVVANANYGIKNSNFKYLNLTGPTEDAERVKGALASAGFEVMVVLDATKSELEESIAEFKLRAEIMGQAARDEGRDPDTVAFFYYSGHGAADAVNRGENYLLPIPENSWIKHPEELDKKAVGLKTITDALYASEPRPAFSFVVIDACRDLAFKAAVDGAADTNPVSRGFVGVQREAPENMLIAYATGENQTADDRSYYSKALADGILKSGLESRRVFIEATQAVRRQTDGTGHIQVPVYKDRLTNDFYFLAVGQDKVALESAAPGASETSKLQSPSLTSSEPIAPLQTNSARPPSNEGVYTGFSGFSAGTSGAINTQGTVIGRINLIANALRMAQKSAASPAAHVPAADIGQVFGIAADMGVAFPGGEVRPPNLYLAATSVYGLPTDRTPATADASHSNDGRKSDQVWAKGLFGTAKGGGPGSIWRRDGSTGEISLFAEVTNDGVKNSGPALGQLAFDPRTRQLFVSDMDTGMIHRLNMKGAELGKFDHGLEGRPKLKNVKAAADDPKSRANPASPQFNAYDPSTWGLPSDRRRVWGIAVRGARLFYGVTDGPEIWSVGIRIDGSFGDDPRRELEVAGAAPGSQIAKIEFDPKGNMYVGLIQGMMALSFDGTGKREPKPAPAAILRYKRNQSGPEWNDQPEQISASGAEDGQVLGASFSLGYGLNAAGDVDPNACAGSLWATAWRPASAGHPATRALLGWSGSHLSLSSLSPNHNPDIDDPQQQRDAPISPLGGILAIAPCDNPQEVAGLVTHPGKRPVILPPTPGLLASLDPTVSAQMAPTVRPMATAPAPGGASPNAVPGRPATTTEHATQNEPQRPANADGKVADPAARPGATAQDAPKKTPDQPAVQDTGVAQAAPPASSASAPIQRPGDAPKATPEASTTEEPTPSTPAKSDTDAAATAALKTPPIEKPDQPKMHRDLSGRVVEPIERPHRPVEKPDQTIGSSEITNNGPATELPPCMKLENSKFQCVAQAWELELNLADAAGKALDALKVSPLAIDSAVEPGFQRRADAGDPFRVRFDNANSGSEVRFDVCLFDEASSRDGNLYRCCRAQIKVELPAVACNTPTDLRDVR